MTTPGGTIISHLSTEFLVVPINAVFDGVVVNPTGDTVQFAFTTGYGSTPATWVAASWDPNPIQGIWYNAKTLIGPGAGATLLTPGTYTVWVMITATPEIPVRQSGTLVIQ